MEIYTYSEARQNMAALLDKADRGECIRIGRKDRHLFELKAATETSSPMDVQGVDLGISTEEIVGFVREGRSCYGE